MRLLRRGPVLKQPGQQDVPVGDLIVLLVVMTELFRTEEAGRSETDQQAKRRRHDFVQFIERE